MRIRVKSVNMYLTASVPLSYVLQMIDLKIEKGEYFALYQV